MKILSCLELFGEICEQKVALLLFVLQKYIFLSKFSATSICFMNKELILCYKFWCFLHIYLLNTA